MKKQSLVYLCAFVLCACGLYAQEDVLRPKGRTGADGSAADAGRNEEGTWVTWGLDLGVNYNMFGGEYLYDNYFTSVNQILDPTLNFPISGSSSASGFSMPYIGAFVDFHFTPKIGLQVKLAYDPKFVSGDEQVEHVVNDIITGAEFTPAENYSYEITGSYLNLGANLRYNIDPNFVLLFGPLVQIPLGDFTRDTVRIVEQGYHYFDAPGTGDFIPQVQGSSDFTAKTRFGFEIGLGYKIPVTNSLYITPSLTYQHMFGDFASPMATSLMEIHDENIQSGTHLLFDQTRTNKSMNSIRLAIGFWFE